LRAKLAVVRLRFAVAPRRVDTDMRD
jgi:hypothetical protein